jgi:hypothetical protein
MVGLDSDDVPEHFCNVHGIRVKVISINTPTEDDERIRPIIINVFFIPRILPCINHAGGIIQESAQLRFSPCKTQFKIK